MESKKFYEFDCDGAKIIEKCSGSFELCEIEINDQLLTHKVKLVDDQITSLQAFSKESGDKSKCAISDKKQFLNCSIHSNCREKLNVNEIFKALKERESAPFCSMTYTAEAIEKKELSSELSDAVRVNIHAITGKVKNYCGQLPEDQQLAVSEGLNSILRALSSNVFEKTCLQYVSNEKNGPYSAMEKKDLVKRLLASILNDYDNELKTCNGKSSPLFKEGLPDLDHYLCVKTQNVETVFNLKCQKKGRDSALIASSATQKTFNQASLASAATHTETVAGETPVIIPASNATSSPIPVGSTLAEIDKIFLENGSKVTPEVAVSAGRLFGQNILEPLTEATRYVAAEIAIQTSGAKPKSIVGSDVARIGSSPGVRSTTSADEVQVPTVTKRDLAATAQTLVPSTAKSAGVNVKAKPSVQAAGGKANLVKTIARAPGAETEPQGFANSGSGGISTISKSSLAGGGNKGTGPQPQKLDPGQNQALESANFVSQFTQIANSDELKKRLTDPDFTAQLNAILDETAGVGDRGPASNTRITGPLAAKFNALGVKVVDLTSKRSIYIPEKTEFILQRTAQGYRLVRPIIKGNK